jgi:hypothetical protein
MSGGVTVVYQNTPAQDKYGNTKMVLSRDGSKKLDAWDGL